MKTIRLIATVTALFFMSFFVFGCSWFDTTPVPQLRVSVVESPAGRTIFGEGEMFDRTSILVEFRAGDRVEFRQVHNFFIYPSRSLLSSDTRVIVSYRELQIEHPITVVPHGNLLPDGRPIPVESITISGQSHAAVGAPVPLTANILPANAAFQMVTWQVSDGALIADNGMFMALQAGVFVVTATAGGISTTKAIQVVADFVPATDITLDRNFIFMQGGGAAQSIAATVHPANATSRSIEWSSSNTIVATVSNNGIVSGFQAGTAIISATVQDTNIFAYVTVEVVLDQEVTLTFNDEFQGNTIDETKWDFMIGMGSQGPNNPWGNRELQFYRQENAEIDDGNLVINVRRENVIFRWLGNNVTPNVREYYITTTPLAQINFNAIPGLAGTRPQDVRVLTSAPSAGIPNVVGALYMAEFSSTRMRTQAGFNQMFGRFEAKISLPAYQGMWPAFWMMPQTNTIAHGGWPRNGEIDIMEARGRVPDRVAQTIHFGSGSSPANHTRHRWLGRSPDYRLPVGQTIADFIVYRVDWHPDRIDWYIDGRQVASIPQADWRNVPGWRPTGTDTNPTISTGWGAAGQAAIDAMAADGRTGINTAFIQRPDRPGAPFDHPFHMLLNVAVGGWYDTVDGVHIRPLPSFTHGQMRVEWVRAWQFNDYLDWYFCFATNTPIMP